MRREAVCYDEAAVRENQRRSKDARNGEGEGVCACPGTRVRTLSHEPAGSQHSSASEFIPEQSQLGNWPVQIKLAPTHAPYFKGAALLVAADCCAYAYASFHRQFIHERTCLIGCPKLDGVDYRGKLSEIIAENDIQSLVICRMEVPCCGGLERMAAEALKSSGKTIPWEVVTFSLDGKILR